MQYEPIGAYIYGAGVEEDQIERGGTDRGWIFWDADSFERENLICYVADCSDQGYTRKDFLELAGGDEKLAREIFFRCMGPTPQECLREIEQEREKEKSTMEKENKTPRETSSEFRERAIQERIDVILGEHLQETDEYYKAGSRIMDGLDQQTTRKFEEFISEYVTISGKEYRMIYMGGLADGLRLGAKVFGNWKPEDE